MTKAEIEDKMVEDEFQTLVDAYLASKHRKKVDVITKAFTIDKGLNSIIGFLESTHIIKKGEMTKVIHESLWQWVLPYQKMFDEYYHHSMPAESAAEYTMPKAVPTTNTEEFAGTARV